MCSNYAEYMRKGNYMKKILTLFLLALFLMIGTFLPAKASYSETDFLLQEDQDKVTAVFNLTDELQSQTIYDKNGVPVILSVSRTPSFGRTLSNGQYVVSANKNGIKMSYKVHIFNQKMTNVSDGYYSILLSIVTNSTLKLVSPTYSTYTVSGYDISGSFTHILSASISNGQLVTSFK